MAECHSDPQTNLLYPWALDTVESTWNRLGAEALGFRVWTAGKANSRSKAAARLTYILRDNAHWLGGSRHTDVDVLLESFIAHLMASLIGIKQQGIERINEQTGSEMNARLTFWRYLDPDLRAMKHLSDQQLGITDQDNVEDIQRRRDKATLLREFASEVKSIHPDGRLPRRQREGQQSTAGTSPGDRSSGDGAGPRRPQVGEQLMHLLEHYFFWASDGAPDAVPAGIIAVDIGLNEADHNDPDAKAICNYCCSLGLFDDSTLQLGFTKEDKDLIFREQSPNFLCTTQIVADWQWAEIKKRPGLRYAEHNLRKPSRRWNGSPLKRGTTDPPNGDAHTPNQPRHSENEKSFPTSCWV